MNTSDNNPFYKGEKVWVWSPNGSLTEGVFEGHRENEWYSVYCDGYSTMKPLKYVFNDYNLALAWQFVKKYKRLCRNGTDSEQILKFSDSDVVELAREYFPEELI